MPTMKSDVRDSLFIGGRWVPSTGSGSIDVIDSTTEAVIGTVPEGTVEDIDRAVAAAAGCLPGLVDHAGGRANGPADQGRRDAGRSGWRTWPPSSPTRSGCHWCSPSWSRSGCP